MNTLHFTVAGTPAPQGSKRYLGRANGRGVMVESSKKVAPWRADVRNAAEQAMGDDNWSHLWDSSLLVRVQFLFDRPKNHYRTGRNAHLLRDTAPERPAGRPDVDKLARAVLDALTGVVWRDDSKIVSLWVSKMYGDPGARISVGAVAP